VWGLATGFGFRAQARILVPQHTRSRPESSKSALQRAQGSVCTVIRSRGMDVNILLYIVGTMREARGAVQNNALSLYKITTRLQNRT
jgi:hypothetical protein